MSESIHAFCPSCHADEFLIHNWQETDWAGGPMEPVPVEEVFGVSQESVTDPRDQPAQRVSEMTDPVEDDPLASVLAAIGSSMRASELRHMISTAESPMAVINTVLEGLARPPKQASVERLFPVLMDAWNTTARPELGGRTPHQVHHEARPSPSTRFACSTSRR
ncbi:hypothetical protein [Enhygromyxa salina]|uniref:hypothetical protein n=1 Tax=Enhygromyxa salina TaxID=215803 RepID=UPI0011B1D3B0|nr:hypothetical protein [Enhygromyxa salina]